MGGSGDRCRTSRPRSGRLGFNSRPHGRPAILAHVYGAQPAPASYTLPFVIEERAKGTFGIVLSASLFRIRAQDGPLNFDPKLRGARWRMSDDDEEGDRFT